MTQGKMDLRSIQDGLRKLNTNKQHDVKEFRQEQRTWVILIKCRVLFWGRNFRKDFSERRGKKRGQQSHSSSSAYYELPTHSHGQEGCTYSQENC